VQRLFFEVSELSYQGGAPVDGNSIEYFILRFQINDSSGSNILDIYEPVSDLLQSFLSLYLGLRISRADQIFYFYSEPVRLDAQIFDVDLDGDYVKINLSSSERPIASGSIEITDVEALISDIVRALYENEVFLSYDPRPDELRQHPKTFELGMHLYRAMFI